MWGGALACGVVAALAFVWAGLALAWGAAAVQWMRTACEWTGWEILGLVLGLAWAAGCMAGLFAVGRRWGDRALVATATLAVLAVGVAWAWGTRGLADWPMDSGFFRWFLDRMAEGGFTVENLRGLAGNYDYGAWTTRAWPVFLPLRRYVGAEGFALWVQLAQAAMLAVCIPLAWRVAELLGGKRAARLAVAALAGMPAFALHAVGLNHQVLGALEYLSAIWLLAEWMFGGGGAKKKAALASGMCALAAAACFEGSAWSLFLLGATALLLFEILRPGGRRILALAALAAMVFLPAWVGRTASCVVLAPARAANPEPLNGGSLAFMARGWDFASGGEYSDTLQTLDVLTPCEEKDRFFKAYLAGQCVWNGPALLSRLFPQKVAKFMLAGYAGVAEEVLSANGAERTAKMVRGARVGWFVLLYAPLMLWGLFRLAKCCGEVRTAWLVAPVAAFAVAVMLAGETSPRYALPVLVLFLAAGACGWAGRREENADRTLPMPRHPFVSGAGIAGGAVLLFAVALLGSRGVLRDKTPWDMRTALLEAGRPAAGRSAAFEAEFPSGEGTATWPGKGGSAVVYLRGNSWSEKGTAEVEAPLGRWVPTSLPARMEWRWEEGEPRRILVRRTDGAGALGLGYVFWGD